MFRRIAAFGLHPGCRKVRRLRKEQAQRRCHRRHQTGCKNTGAGACGRKRGGKPDSLAKCNSSHRSGPWLRQMDAAARARIRRDSGCRHLEYQRHRFAAREFSHDPPSGERHRAVHNMRMRSRREDSDANWLVAPPRSRASPSPHFTPWRKCDGRISGQQYSCHHERAGDHDIGIDLEGSR
jgi:hypothetical protein